MLSTVYTWKAQPFPGRHFVVISILQLANVGTGATISTLNGMKFYKILIIPVYYWWWRLCSVRNWCYLSTSKNRIKKCNDLNTLIRIPKYITDSVFPRPIQWAMMQPDPLYYDISSLVNHCKFPNLWVAQFAQRSYNTFPHKSHSFSLMFFQSFVKILRQIYLSLISFFKIVDNIILFLKKSII